MKKTNLLQTQFRVGIIGCGLIADKLDDSPTLAPGRIDLPWAHAPAYHMIPDTKIVAVSDVNEKAMAEFATRWEIPATYTDYRKMFDQENLDIVSVLAPNFLHCEMTIAAAEAGVGVVFCEVPMSSSLEEADQMIEACRKTGTQLVVDVGGGRWWAREYMNAKEIIDTGGIGDIVTMITSITSGLVLNGTCMLDMFRFFAGSDVREVFGWLYDMPGPESEYIDRGATAFLRFENGIEAIFNGQDGKPFAEWDIMGTEGRIRIGNHVLELWKSNKESPSGEMLSHPFPQRYTAKAARVAIIEKFVAYLRGEEEDISNGADGRAAMEIALAIYESHDTGGWVKLPLTKSHHKVNVLHGPRAWE